MERALFVEALRRLDPAKPAGDEEYQPRPGWDRFDEIVLQLDADVRFRMVLHGSVGVGKTTELLYWARRLEEKKVGVQYLQVELHGKSLEEFVRNATVRACRLLLLDGLDLQPDRAEQNFGPGTSLVDPGLPALVAVAPHAIGRWGPDRRDPKIQLVQLLPFPVLDRDGRAAWDGVHALAQLLSRRLGSVPVLERVSVLKRVALMSGGVPRDAVRILRGAVLSAAKRLMPVTVGDVTQGERELRQDFEQAFISGDKETLNTVRTQRVFLHPHERLLTMGAVLSYEDEQGAYAYPHPVLLADQQRLMADAALAANMS